MFFQCGLKFKIKFFFFFGLKTRLKQHVFLVTRSVRSKLKLKTELFLEKWKTFYIIDPAKSQRKTKRKKEKTNKQQHDQQHSA